jgi:hypothetical protein
MKGARSVESFTKSMSMFGADGIFWQRREHDTASVGQSRQNDGW